jgi:hypothetical protein
LVEFLWFIIVSRFCLPDEHSLTEGDRRDNHLFNLMLLPRMKAVLAKSYASDLSLPSSFNFRIISCGAADYCPGVPGKEPDMHDTKPTLEDWKSIYEAAKEFGKLETWKWMTDSDIFGVQNPANGEIGYCCIMGMAEEVYGLSAYRGSNGLEGYLKVECDEVSPEDVETIFMQDSLTVFYENRDLVQKEDMEVIRSLGLKFRGRNAWPVFREYKPGYYPWFFTGEQAHFFRILLEQAIDVALRFKLDRALLSYKSRDRFLVRVPSQAQGRIVWRDEWLAPAPIEREELPPGSLDEIRIRRVKGKSKAHQGTLEIDCFLTPAPVQERPDERPFYPDAVVIIEERSGIVTELQLDNHGERGKTLQETFLRHIETTKSIPKNVLVRKEEVFRFLEPLAAELEFGLTMTEKLSHMDNFKEGLFDQIIGRR